MNRYVFVVRAEGIIDHTDREKINEAMAAAAYLQGLGISFIVVTHNRNSDYARIISDIFGARWSTIVNQYYYICPNDASAMIVMLNKISKIGAPVSFARRFVYLDSYEPYLNIAASVGMSAYKNTNFTCESARKIIYNILDVHR